MKGWNNLSCTHWAGRISMMEIPVSLSPFSTVWIIGDAPRHLGNILGCTLRIPLQQNKKKWNTHRPFLLSWSSFLELLLDVPGSHGTVKWVSAFRLSNNNTWWWWMWTLTADRRTQNPTWLTWFEGRHEITGGFYMPDVSSCCPTNSIYSSEGNSKHWKSSTALILSWSTNRCQAPDASSTLTTNNPLNKDA